MIARVGEGIVTTVGSADSHKSVLENPDSISKAILQKGLDIGTAFQILSIDIADVDIGRNIGAHLQSLQILKVIIIQKPILPVLKASAKALGTSASAATTLAFISCSRATAAALLSSALACAIFLSASA